MAGDNPLNRCEPASTFADGGTRRTENIGYLAPLSTPANGRTAVEETAGALTGIYEAGELKSMREDWPA